MRPEAPTPDNPPPPPPAGGLAARVGRWIGAAGTQRRVLARNALWNWGSFVLHALVIYFLSPYIVHTLDKGPYGYWEAVIQLIGYLGFADLGVRPAIVYFVARHDALDEREEVDRFVNTAFVTLSFGGLLVLAVTAICAPLAPDWFRVDASWRSDTIWATAIVGITFACSLPLNAFSALLIGKQRFDLSCRVDVAIIVVRTVAVVATLKAGYGLVGLAAAHALSTLIEMLWKTRLAWKVQPGLRFAPRLAKRVNAKALLTFGGFNIIVVLALRLTYQTDALVIAAKMSLAAVALFAFGAKLATYTRDMLFSAGRILAPAMGAMEAKGGGSARAIGPLLSASSRNLLLVATPLFAYWVLFGGAFLEAWLEDPAFREGGAMPLTILALGSIAPVATYPMLELHRGTNRMRSLALFCGLEGVANLVLSLLLVGPHGLAGVALGTAIPAFVIHGVVMPWWICRSLDLSFWHWLRGGCIVPLLAGAAIVVPGVMLLDLDATRSWPVLIGSGIALLLVYAALALLLMRVLRPARSDGLVYRGPEGTAAGPPTE